MNTTIVARHSPTDEREMNRTLLGIESWTSHEKPRSNARLKFRREEHVGLLTVNHMHDRESRDYFVDTGIRGNFPYLLRISSAWPLHILS